MRSEKAMSVLVVEDNPADSRLIVMALKDGCGIENYTSVDDGEKAMDFLMRKGCYSGYGEPDLIILDLNLPKISGFEILDFVKNDDKLNMIPVVILSTSDSGEDISRAYRMRANSYVVKPAELEGFLSSVRGVGKYWSEISARPAM